MHNPKIDSNAIENYTSESCPQLFKQVGTQGLIEIQKHDRDSAELVSKLPECDLVEYVGHSNTKVIIQPKLPHSLIVKMASDFML